MNYSYINYIPSSNSNSEIIALQLLFLKPWADALAWSSVWVPPSLLRSMDLTLFHPSPGSGYVFLFCKDILNLWYSQPGNRCSNCIRWHTLKGGIFQSFLMTVHDLVNVVWRQGGHSVKAEASCSVWWDVGVRLWGLNWYWLTCIHSQCLNIKLS